MSFLRAVGSVSNRLSLYERASYVTMTVRHETTSIAALSIILKNEFNKETTLFFALSIEFLSEIFAAPSLKKCHLRQCSAAATSPCFTRHFLVRSNQDTNWAGIHIDAKNNSQRSKKNTIPSMEGPRLCTNVAQHAVTLPLPSQLACALPCTRFVDDGKNKKRWKNTTK